MLKNVIDVRQKSPFEVIQNAVWWRMVDREVGPSAPLPNDRGSLLRLTESGSSFEITV